MRVESLELFWIKMPLVSQFTTSFGTTTEREILLVKANADGASGWGESGADGMPMYSYETASTGWHIIEDFLAPVVLDEEWPDKGLAAAYAKKFSSWRWHPMARCAVEEALWVLDAQRQDVSLQSLYANGRSIRDRIPVGISLGIEDDFEVLAEKIQHANDVEGVFEKFGLSGVAGDTAKKQRVGFGVKDSVVDAVLDVVPPKFDGGLVGDKAPLAGVVEECLAEWVLYSEVAEEITTGDV